jgi:hypothetical protein
MRRLPVYKGLTSDERDLVQGWIRAANELLATYPELEPEIAIVHLAFAQVFLNKGIAIPLPDIDGAGA